MEDITLIAAARLAAGFEKSVSHPRFKRYLRAHPDPLDAVAVYLWNMSLCGSLYPAVQCLEVTYRNALNDALRTHMGTPNWFDDMALMLPHQQKSVLAAKDELRRQRKFIDPGRVVAELSFGFWAALYSGPYTSSIVHPTINTVFPHAPKRLRDPRNLSSRLQEARKLRNRIFHHEPIWHWVSPAPATPTLPTLMSQYEDMLALISWIGGGQLRLSEQIDDFRKVHDQGWQPFRTKVDSVLLEEMIAEESAQATT